MDLIVFLIGFTLTWVTILFTHYLLVSCMVHPYLNLTKLIGLQVKPFYLGIYWNRFHHGLIHFTKNHDESIRCWTNLGVFASFFLTPVSICILLQTITNLIAYDKSDSSNDFGSLEPFLPGINLPLDEIAYYVIALLISSVLHEFGHFIAAIKEGVKVNGVGLSLFGFLPVAYVDISEDQLRKISIGGKLRIFCAGVWHNLALGLLTAILLLANPSLLYPLYSTGTGVVVLDTQENWDASGIHGIQSNDLITSINRNCYVTSKDDWKSCFLQLITNPDEGYCIPDNFITKEMIKREKDSPCCDPNLKRHLCFDSLIDHRQLCLPARQLLERYQTQCNETVSCLMGHVCVRPKSENRGFRLMELQRRDKPSFLFWGHPYEVYSSLYVINYNPRFKFLPLSVVQKWETLLRYITSFSLALALLNSVPCFVMDGKYIARSSLELLFGRITTKQSLKLVNTILSMFGTLLVCCCVFFGFVNIIMRNHSSAHSLFNWSSH